MNWDILFTVIQPATACLLVWRCCRVRKHFARSLSAIDWGQGLLVGIRRWVREGYWIPDALMFVATLGAAMILWRVLTWFVFTEELQRQIGGMGIQTLYILATFILVQAIGQLSDRRT